MPEIDTSRPIRRILLASVVAVVAVLGLGLADNRFETTPELIDGSGTLTVDGIVYEFTPTTCVISDEDFVAAGTGFDDGERFWVSASSVGLDLAVGTESEIEEPAEDQLWLISEDEVIDWSAQDETVIAEANMTDQRSPQSTTVHGSLELHCDVDV